MAIGSAKSKMCISIKLKNQYAAVKKINIKSVICNTKSKFIINDKNFKNPLAKEITDYPNAILSINLTEPTFMAIKTIVLSSATVFSSKSSASLNSKYSRE